MLHLFYGPGPKQEKINKLLKNNVGEVSKITDLDFSIEKLKSLTSAQGLFNNQLTLVLENVISSKEIEKDLEDLLEDLSKSSNNFIFVENAISPDLLLSFQENGEVVQSSLAEVAKPIFNIFSLTDAFGSKDKKKTWLLFTEAIGQLAPEEIANMLHWQIKNITLIKNSKNPTETGLNPYVVKKASSFSKNFSLMELKKLSSKLVGIFHENRKTDRDLAIDLEKFILESL